MPTLVHIVRRSDPERKATALAARRRSMGGPGPAMGNQAARRLVERRKGRSPLEEPQTPEEIAERTESQLDVDPEDASGQVRERLDAMAPEDRSEVLTRLADRVSTSNQDRLAEVVSTPAPPVIEPSLARPQEEGTERDEAEEMAEAPTATEEPVPAPDQRPDEREDQQREPQPREPEPRKAEEPLTREAAARWEEAKEGLPGKGGEKRREEQPTAAEAEEEEAPRRRTGARDTAVPERKRAPAQGRMSEARAPETEAVRPERAAFAEPAGGGPAGAAGPMPQAAAMKGVPTEARGESAGAPAGPAEAQQATPAGPAPAVPAAEAAGGSGEAAIEEAPSDGPAAEEQAQAEDKMDAAEPDEHEEQPEPLPPEPAPDAQPSAEDQALARVSEEDEKQPEAEPSSDDAATQETEDEDRPPAAQADVPAAQKQAGLDSLAEEVGSADAGIGGGGSAAIAETPPPPSPEFSAAKPAAAMSSLARLKVAVIARGMKGVSTAIAGDASARREDMAAHPPQIERPSGAPQTRAVPISAEFPEEAGSSTPVIVRQATESQNAAPPESALEPEPEPDPGPNPVAAVEAPTVSGGESGQMTQYDAQNLRGAVLDMPTSDATIATDAGPAPSLLLDGDADPQQTRDQRASLQATISAQQAQGAHDAAVPQGEDQIFPQVQPETLEGHVSQTGGAAESAGGVATVEDQTAALVAEERQGESVRSSIQRASDDMAARQQEHVETESRKRDDSDREMAGIIQANASQQTDQRQAAREKAAELRGQWSEEQRNAVDKAQNDADGVHERAEEQVAAKQAEANARSQAEIDRGSQQAAQEKQRGEEQAQRKKDEAQQESSGVFGWLASKAKAFFEGLKRAVTAIITVMRTAVRSAIAAAKKLAFAAIDIARSAVIGLIRIAGDALMSVGDGLLAAFPGLRARFRKLIRQAVAAAEDAVNRLADALKTAVAAALDLLCAALDGLLQLLEKGLHAALDFANSVVQGAIKAAQAVVAAYAAFIAIIKDVAANPVQWIRNLAAAVLDGIRNHLWKAFKAAIKNWFEQKLSEVLGVGMMIFQVLMRGGIALAEVGKMAFEGLKSAIPMALIAILVEKLVAMIVPAVGAIMTIIEGLQAAWGTISRIIAAISRFIEFLKAVKTGQAGPKFAEMLAAAAIVVIDFVANWLIRRIRRPAGKIGGKIKAIARKIMEKLKAVAKRVGRAIRRALGRVKAGFKRLFMRKRRKRTPRQRQRDAARKRRRVDEAIRATTQAVQSMISAGVSLVRLKIRLAFLRLRYRWASLRAIKQGRGLYSVEGVINPRRRISKVVAEVRFIKSRRFTLRYTDVEDKTGGGEYDNDEPRGRLSSGLFEVGVVAGLKARRSAPGEGSQLVAGPALTEMAPELAGQPIQYASKYGSSAPQDISVRVGQELKLPKDTGGRQRVRRTPEAIVEHREPVVSGGKLKALYVVEATLDVGFALKEGTRASHKKVQLPTTLALAISQLPPRRQRTQDFKIVYTIFSHGSPPDEIRDSINESFREAAPKRVRIEPIWIEVPLL